MSKILQELNKFVDEMREKKAEYSFPEEAYVELEKASAPFVHSHSVPLQCGHVKVTFITEAASKLVSAYYGSSFDKAMPMQEYLEMVGLVQAKD